MAAEKMWALECEKRGKVWGSEGEFFGFPVREEKKKTLKE